MLSVDGESAEVVFGAVVVGSVDGEELSFGTTVALGWVVVSFGVKFSAFVVEEGFCVTGLTSGAVILALPSNGVATLWRGAFSSIGKSL